MSRNVEERVVKMRFDNKEFEPYAKTTMETLDRLEKKSSFKEHQVGLASLASAIGKVSFTPMENGINTVGVKFSALQVLAVTALQDIANTAWRKGKEIAEALTIDPIKTGMSEYETKINAIQVIKANTRGKNTMDDITKALDELNTYADKTIYNFAQMTSNIGKFVAQGQDVYQATNAVKGMANLAAASGASAEDMSRATYQMSQALGGVIRKIDWNSLRNANMATVDLKNTILDVARASGVAIDEIMADKGTFEESLEAGWLTGDIFTEAMNMYSGIYDEAQLKAKGYTDAQIKNFIELAKTAESAATEVKTISQLWDVLKETAQSGWTQSWEYIIGDFETAKRDLTQLQIFLSDKINASADARNKVLKEWNEQGGRDDLVQSLKNIYDAVTSMSIPIRNGIQQIFPPVTTKQLLAATSAIEEFTRGLELGFNGKYNLQLIFKNIASSVKDLYEAISSYVSPIKEAIQEFIPDDWITRITAITSAISDFTSKLTATAEQQAQIKNIASGVLDGIGIVYGFLKEIVKGLYDLVSGNGGTLVQFFLDTAEGIGVWITSVRDALDASNKFSESVEAVVAAISGMVGALTGVFTGFINMITAVFNSVSGLFGGVTTVLEAVMMKMNDAFGLMIDGVVMIIKGIGAALQSGNVQIIIDIINGGILASILANVKKLTDGLVGFSGALSKILKVYEGFGNTTKQASGSVSGVLKELTEVLVAVQEQIKAKALISIAIAVAILSGSLIALSMVDTTKMDSAVSAITLLLMSLVGVFEVLTRFSDQASIAGVLKMQLIFGPLMGIALSTLILAETLKNLVGIDENQMTNATMGMITIVGSLFAMAKLMNGVKIKMTSAVSIIIMAKAIEMLAEPFVKLSSIGLNDGLASAAASFVVIIAYLSIMALLLDRVKVKPTTALSVALLAASIDIVAAAFIPLASLPLEQALVASVALMSITASLLLVAIGLSKVKMKPLTVVMLAIMAQTISVLADVMTQLSRIRHPEGLITAATSLGVIVAALVVTAGLFGYIKVKPVTIVMLTVMAAAIKILADVMIELSAIGFGTNLMAGIAGLTVIVSDLVLLANGLNRVKVNVTSSASLVILAYAVQLLGDVLIKISVLSSFSNMVESVIALTIIIADLALAGLLLDKVKVNPVTTASLLVLAYAFEILGTTITSVSRIGLNENFIAGIVGLLSITGNLVILGALLDRVKVKPTTAASMVILAYALQLMTQVLGDTVRIASSDDLLSGVLAMYAIATALIGMGLLLNKVNVKMTTGVALIAMAYSMQLLVEALIPLSEQPLYSIGIAIAELGAIMLELGIALRLVPKSSAVRALGVLELVLALDLLFPTLMNYATLSSSQILTILESLGGVLLGFTLSLAAIPATAPIKALGMVMIVGTLYLLVPLIKELGSLPIENVAQGIGILLSVFVTIAYSATLIANTGTALYSAALSISVFSISIGILGVALVSLASGISAIAVSLAAAAVGIGAAIGGFIVSLIDGLDKIINSIKKLLIDLLQLLIDLAPKIAETLSALVKMLVDVFLDNVPFLTEGILTLIDQTLKALVQYAPSIVENLLKVIEVILDGLAGEASHITAQVMKILDGIVTEIGKEISKADPYAILQGVEAFALVSGLMYMSAGLSKLLKPALKGVAAAGVIVGEIVAVMAILGALTSDPKIHEFVEKGADMLMKVSEALGGVIGAFIGGFVTGTAVAMEDTMEHIKVIGTSIKEFADGIKDLPDNFESKVDIIVVALGKLLGTNLKAQVGSWFGGKDVGTTMEEALPKLASALFKFSEATKKMDDTTISNVERAITALDSMVELADHIPGQGGLTMLFTGDDTLKGFGESMIAFGKDIETFSTNMGSVSDEDIGRIELLGNAMTAMTAMAESLPKSGGLVGMLTGNHNLGKLGKSLSPLGDGVKAFAESIEGLDEDTSTQIEIASSAISALIELNEKVPKTGGLAGLLGGDNDFAKFGEKMASFGASFGAYAESVDGITEDSIDKIKMTTEAAQLIVDMSNSIGNTGGLGTIFTGDNDLTDFSKKLPAFATAIRQYAGGIQNFSQEDVEAIGRSVDGARLISDLAKELPETGGLAGLFTGGTMDLGKFSTELVRFGGSMLLYAESVMNISDDSLAAMSRATQAASEISAMAKDLPEDSGVFGFFTGNNDLDTFGKNLVKFGHSMHKYTESVSNIDESTIPAVEKSVEIASAVVELCKTLPEDHGIIGFFTGDNDLDTFAGNLSAFGNSMYSYTQCIKDIDSNSLTSATAATDIAKQVIAMCEILPSDSGVIGFFTGDNDLDTFASNLTTFGEAMSSYIANVEDINPESAYSSVSTARSIVSLIKDVQEAEIGDFDGGTFKTSILSVSSAMQGFFEDVSEITGDNATAMTTAMTTIVTFVTDFNTIDFATFKSNVDLINGIDGINTAFINEFAASFANGLPSVAPSLQTFVSGVKVELVDGFANAMDEMTQSFKMTIQSAIQSGIILAKPEATKKAKEIVTSMGSGIRSNASAATGAIRNVGSQIVSTMSSLTSTAYSIGQNLSLGLASGINSRAQVAIDAAKSTVQQVNDIMAKTAQTHSPSHFTGWIGEMYIRGLANNLLHFAYLATNAAETVVNDTNSAFELGLGDVYGADSMFNPTITPLLDLSNIEHGLAAMSTMFNNPTIDSVGIEFNYAMEQQKVNQLNKLVDLCDRLVIMAGNPTPVVIDGKEVIGFVNRGLGGLA